MTRETAGTGGRAAHPRLARRPLRPSDDQIAAESTRHGAGEPIKQALGPWSPASGGERPVTHGASEGRCRPVRDDRLKELADAEWRKLLAKRQLEPPGLRDADGPAVPPVSW